MPTYKDMYLAMMRASEAAIRILEQTQRDCEEMYMELPGPAVMELPTEKAPQTD